MSQGAHTDAGAGGSTGCQLCPICALLHTISTTRPEVTEHLLAAGRELTLAVKAALDGHATAEPRGDNPLQRIKIT